MKQPFAAQRPAAKARALRKRAHRFRNLDIVRLHIEAEDLEIHVEAIEIAFSTYPIALLDRHAVSLAEARRDLRRHEK